MKTFWRIFRMFVYSFVFAFCFHTLKDLVYPSMSFVVSQVICITLGIAFVMQEEAITNYLNQTFILPWKKQ